jgi:hypothetical protein
MRKILGLVALGAMVSAGAPAQAAQFLYTVTGTVAGDEFTYDDWHVFDPVQGQAFTAEFLVDDAAPTSLYTYGATTSSASGGGATQLGTRSPVFGSLTIGSNTYDVRQGDYHLYPSYDPDPVGPIATIEESGLAAKDAVSHQLTLAATYDDYYSCCFPHANDTYDQGEGLDFTLHSAGFTSPDYRQGGTFALAPGSYGEFYKYETIVAWPGNLTNIFLAATSLQVTPLGAVPEIGTWLMMVLGIGGAGLSARSRRNARVA